jgi:photosystem II stability/assembly factor-like uncharacterized protein
MKSTSIFTKKHSFFKAYLILLTLISAVCDSNAQCDSIRKVADGSGCNYSLFFATPDTVYVVGCQIVKTTDRGRTWTFLSTPQRTGMFLSCFFTSKETGYAGGQSGMMMKTIDGGKTWQILDLGMPMDVNSIFFTTPDTGYVIGQGGFIFKTIDAGMTWTQTNIGIDGGLYSLCFINPNIGFLSCYHITILGHSYGYLYKTIDAGATWNIVYTADIYQITSIHFADNLNGYAVAGVAVLKTTDGGNTWAQLNNVPFNRGLFAVRFIDLNHGIVGGEEGQIYKTDDGGSNWHQLRNSGGNIYGMFNDGQSLYAVDGAGEFLQIACANEFPPTILGNSNVSPGLYSYIISNISNVTCNWSISSGGSIVAIKGDTAKVNWGNTSGVYDIICNLSNGTVLSYSVTVNPNTTTGIFNTSFANQVYLYPNPTNGDFSINLPKGEFIGKIFSSTGQEVKNFAFTEIDNKIKFNNALRGVYYVQILSHNESIVEKLIVE